ncbi:MAG: antibiotic biosynthesis monooxygenase [Aggregatilineales bacterium]
MIRLTVMYNLPEGTDEDEFLRWRLTEHQAENAGMPGVIRTDFARIENALPGHTPPQHRFMTIAEWADRESFEAAFMTEAAQADLKNDLDRIRDAVFMVSEILVSSEDD